MQRTKLMYIMPITEKATNWDSLQTILLSVIDKVVSDHKIS